LNFPPGENYRTRSVKAYKAEQRKIDVTMYRITDRQHSDQMLAAVARGIPVRLITEPAQYRLTLCSRRLRVACQSSPARTSGFPRHP
jgi:hypothetical protein